jgi:hypothetical protein
VCMHAFSLHRESPDLDPGRWTPHFWGGSVTLLKFAFHFHRWSSRMGPCSPVQARGRKLGMPLSWSLPMESRSSLPWNKRCDAACSIIFFRVKGHFVRHILWWCYNCNIVNCLPYCWPYVWFEHPGHTYGSFGSPLSKAGYDRWYQSQCWQ